MSWGLDKSYLNEKKIDLIMDGADPHQSKEKTRDLWKNMS